MTAYSYAITEADDERSATLEIRGSGGDSHLAPAWIYVNDRGYGLDDWSSFSDRSGLVLTATYKRFYPPFLKE